MKRDSNKYSWAYSWGELIEQGVKFIYGANEHNCDIGNAVKIGKGTKIWPGVTIDGEVEIGEYCEVGKGATIVGKIRIGNNVKIGHHAEITGEGYIGNDSVIKHDIENPRISRECTIEGKVIDSVICEGCEIGEFAEVKRTFVGYETKIKHDSVILDAEIGCLTNIAAGVKIWNYNGRTKGKTKIGNKSFIGGDVTICGFRNLTLGNEVFLAEGSRISHDIPDRMYVNQGAAKNPKVGAYHEHCSWFLEGNYLAMKKPIHPEERARFLAFAKQRCGYDQEKFKKWLETPGLYAHLHTGLIIPIEYLTWGAEGAIECLLGKCGHVVPGIAAANV